LVALLCLLHLALAHHRIVTVTGSLGCRTGNNEWWPINDAWIELYEDETKLTFPDFKNRTTTGRDGTFRLVGEDTELFRVHFYLTVRIPCSESTKQHCPQAPFHRFCEKMNKYSQGDYYYATYYFEYPSEKGIFEGFFSPGWKDSYNLRCELVDKAPGYKEALECNGGICKTNCVEEDGMFFG
ncbi:hypothetical protein PFISCL1PPCAC_24080, partial [Pristionchus fissidentatus]